MLIYGVVGEFQPVCCGGAAIVDVVINERLKLKVVIYFVM